MRNHWRKRLSWAAGVIVVAAAVGWLAWPRPIPVDLAKIGKGPLEVTVDEEGKTHVRHVYTVSAPIAGKVLRISHPAGVHGASLHVGDAVKAGETVVAVMQPMLPSFLDVRSREELQAAIASADAGIVQAEADVRRLQAALEFARAEFERAQSLSRSQSISLQALDRAKFEATSGEAALLAARAQIDARRATRNSLAARLIDPANVADELGATCCVQIRAPVTGRVLKITQDSEAAVQPGAPLLDIGDPLDLEVVADLLSTDAVRIKVGASVRIDGWGGAPLQGKVIRVDPAGFMKVSALGIEEQRVRATIDFVDPNQQWAALGHDYRVIVHVTVWQSADAVRVPVAALFRQGEDWAVFAVRDGRARATVLKLGERNSRSAEVLSGIAPGDRVVLHPSDRVRDGVAVAERETQ